jgi:hypothetical protein
MIMKIHFLEQGHIAEFKRCPQQADDMIFCKDVSYVQPFKIGLSLHTAGFFIQGSNFGVLITTLTDSSCSLCNAGYH